MPGFVKIILALLLIALVFVAIAVWGRRRTSTMAACTNRLLFAIAILQFAVVIKLVSSGLDIFVLLTAVMGLGVGWYGISAEPR